MRNTVLLTLLLSLFGSFFIGKAFAVDCGPGCSEERNIALLSSSIEDAQQALDMTNAELAKPEDQRDGKPVAEFLSASILEMKGIVKSSWDARLQSPKGKMRIASFRLKKGKFEEAASLLDQALVGLKKVNRPGEKPY